MASIEPIDISSSDDEFGIDEYVDSDPLPETDTLLASGSPNSRILPPSVARSGTISGYAGYNQNNTSVKRASTSNGNTRGSSPLGARVYNSHDTSLNGNVGRNPTVSSRIGNLFGGDYERLSSKQAFKRTLPASFQQSNNLGEGSSSSRAREIYGKMYNSGELSAAGSRGLNKGNDDDVIMYENRAHRSLPSSLIRGKLISPTQFASIGDPYRLIMGEEKVNEADERQVYQAVMQDMYQPTGEVNVPEGLLSVPLLRHQRIAVAWMIQKEKRTTPCSGGILADDQGLGKTVSMIALIQLQNLMEGRGRSRVVDQAKNAEDKKIEALDSDDDDENGSSALNNENSNQQADGNKLPSEASSSKQKSFVAKPSAGTLVVCPASVLRQWARELEEKVDAECKLSFCIYHGGNRTKKPDDLANYDVVLTTYAIVNIEVPKKPLVDEDEADERNGEKSEIFLNKKRKKTLTVSKKRGKGRKGLDGSFDYDRGGPLAKVNWHRIILDEAQTIKNHRTQVARACCTLRAKRRWCLSGTPIQNAIDDLFSYFRFLRFEPYAASYKKFYATIKVEISRDSLKGYKKLQAILKAIMLRRTKGTLIDGEPIITLPPKTICLKKIDFSAEERAFYARLESESRSKFKAFSAAGTVKQNYATILLMLLRLRQACDHPSLVKGLNSEPVRKDSAEMANKLPTDMVIDLLNRLEASHAICRECEDTSDDPVITMCGHVFCFECVSNILEGEDHTCPASGCKEQLGSDIIFSTTILRNRISQKPDASTLQSEFDEKSEILQREYGSSKIQTVLEIILSNSKVNSAITKVDGEGTSTLDTEIESERPIKAIVFSQWTGMLDLVEEALNQNRIRYRRLDGTMTLAARDRAVKDFNKDPKVTVMLMSLKAGNLGLNMVAACQVILLDLWWNPTTEDQAVDRAHRIGQTRPVTVTRLTIKDTVEDRILALQEEKRKMVSSAFGEDQPGASSSRLTVEDLNYLFKLS